MKTTITQLLKLVVLFTISIAFSLNASPSNFATNVNITESTENQNTFYSSYEKNWKNTLSFNSDSFWFNQNKKEKKSFNAFRCQTATNTTSTTTITEGQTKILTGSPSGGTWSVFSGDGTISGNTYTPGDLLSDRSVTVRYTVNASAGCPGSTADVTFIVQSNCDVCSGGLISLTLKYNGSSTANIIVKDNTDTYFNASVSPGQEFTFVGTNASKNGRFQKNTLEVIINNVLNTTIHVSCSQPVNPGLDFGSFTITNAISRNNGKICPINGYCVDNSNNTTSSTSINKNQTKALSGTPSGGTWSIVYGNGSISGNIYTPANISSNENVTVRYTSNTASGCPASTSDITFTVTIDPCDAVASGNLDTDKDGVSDSCDLDDDNDGILDTDENSACTVSQKVEITTIFSEDFGTGTTRTTNSNVLNHSYQASNAIPDGSYAVASSLSSGLAQYNRTNTNGDRDANIDQTSGPAGGSSNGRYLSINMINTGNVEFYKQELNNLIIGEDYRFRLDLAGLCDNCSHIPIFRLEIQTTTGTVLQSVTSSSIGVQNDDIWRRVVLNFAATTTAVNIVIINQQPLGSSGNDVGVDNIVFARLQCPTNLIDTDKDGIINSLDTDSDNDGCPDATEAASNLPTTATLTGGSNGGSSANLGTTSNNSGLPNGSSQASTTAVLTAEQITSNTIANQSATTGSSVTFTDNATAKKTTIFNSGVPDYNAGSTSTGALTYKWYKNTAPNTVIATSKTLTLNNITSASAGEYKVVVTGANNKCPVEKTVTLTVCPSAIINTTTTSITENQTKTLAGSPSGGTWSVVSGGGTISGTTYTPANITASTAVVVRYTIAAADGCLASSADVTFTITPCPDAINSTTTTSITENQTKTLAGSPSGGTWSVVSGGGTISGTTYTPANITANTAVVVRYTIAAADGCLASSADVTFTVTPCPDAVNSTTTTSITENQTKTLVGSPSGGTWSVVSGGGTISGTTYTPANITVNTAVVVRYTIAAADGCLASSADVTFTITPCPDAINSTNTTSITENQTKTLAGSPSGGTWSIVSGGGTINGTTYTPDDININTDVTIRYTIAADGSCDASYDDVTFTITPVCNVVADNTTTTTSITEGQAKTLTGNPSGGTWSIVSGGGNITGNIYTAPNINTNTTVIIRYTIAANGNCAASTDDVTFTVTPICNVIADNTTSPATISEGQTKTLTGNPSGGTWSIVSGGGTINGSTYTPSDINTDTNVTIRYTIAADGSCAETTDDVTFTVMPDCNVVADNTTSTASISEDQTKTLTGTPASGTWSIVSGGGTINGSIYTPSDINTNIDVTIRYTIAADGTCDESTDDVTFTVTPICNVVADNTTSTVSISEDQTKTLTGTPAGGTWSIVSGGGTINGSTYTPADINTDTTVIIRYTIAADGSCDASYDDVTFTVTPIVSVLGSIGDTVWYDTDGDGIKDANENGLGGATLTLDPGTPGNLADDITITTDVNGNYLFANLPVGVYTITADVTTVTSGLPAGITIADLIPIFDGDGVGTPNTSTLSLPTGVNNLTHDFGYSNTSGNTGTGNDGGVESESLGDAISKIYVGRKKNSAPTEFVKSSENLYSKAKMKSEQPYQGKGQTMLDMFPTELIAGNVANVTSPTDILDYTVADEVLSVDFSVNGKTKGVVLGIKTSDKIYNHTKASCDRLRGAEILNIQTIQIKGYNFLMQGIKQRNGIVEYAISFATAKNNNDAKYTIQTNWYVNNYTKFNDVYNFQVWSTKPADTKKLVTDILENLQSFIPVNQTEIQKVPETYASKIYREKGELVVNLRSTEIGKTADVSMVELYSETANNIKHRYNTLDTEIQQSLRLDIADGYEYDGLIEVDKEVEDAFYHADGNWGLDYDKKYTEVLNYFVWNDFDRTYQDDEYSINRNVEIKATSQYDYLTVYKSLLPGTISADYSKYKYLSFTAKGSGLIELGLIKSSVQNWKEQYRIMVDLSEEEQTYYVPFEYFSSTGTTAKITADDLTTITFTFLPVEANTKELDLFISDVKFTKTAVEDQTIAKIEKFENNFMAYPNPSKGNVNVLLFSKVDAKATVSLFDVTGKEIYAGPVQLTVGKNEIDFNVKVKPGILFLKVNSKQVNYGTSKIMFR